MRKRILSMLCVFALCFTLLPVSALADDVSDWETNPPTTTGGWTATGNYDTSWFDGQNVPGGTQADPYIISDADDLAGLSVIVNGLSTYEKKAYSFKDKYIKIADDATIDLAAHEWTPIGTKSNVYGGDIPEPDGSSSTTSTTAWFKGHFDGNNVSIKNLRITNSDSDVVGLFGYALEAVVEKVTLEDAYISAVDVRLGTYVGGIVALSDGSTVQECKVVSGLITAKNDSSRTSGYVGGIVGTNGKSLYNATFQSSNASHVTDCTNGAKIISAAQYTGGIVGINGAANTAQTKVYCTVTGCTNQGQIEVNSGSTSSKFYAGGIAGGNLTTITNCKNEAAVKNTTGHAAGIAGYFEGRAAYISDDANVLLQNCENTGAVSGYSYAGGIVAYSYSGTNAAIANCTNSGAIASLSGSAGNPEMGGIAGRVGSSKGKFTISNCVNTGSVSGETSETTPSSSGTNTVGGLVGTLRTSFEVSNCYNTGAVTNYAATSSSLLVSTAGGLAGSVGTDGEVHDCYNVGEVKGYRVGGLIGISTASGGSTSQLTDCYNIGMLTGTNVVGGVLGSVMSGCQAPTITDSTYWNGCLSGGNSYGTSKSSNQMTGDNWSSEMGLDTGTWEKSQNTGTTGYLPVLTNNKQDPAPELTRTGLASRTLDITNIPTDGGTERDSFLLSESPFDLNATVAPAVGTVSWTTSNDQVATVDQNGKVTLVGPGEVSITASVAEDATYEKASDSYAFTVTDTITEIIINGLGELSLGSKIPTSASTPDDAKYNIVSYISVGGGTAPDIYWTYEDGTTITGTTFAADHKYKGTIKVEPDTYYSFASDAEVKLSGVGTSVSYTHAADTSNPAAILITISMDYSKTQEEITGVQAADDLVYNGQSQRGYTGEPSSKYTDDYEITYEGVNGTTYSPTSTAPTNAGDYTVLIAIPDSDTTYFGSVKLNFSIGKAAATVKALERNIYVGEEIPGLTNPVKGTDYEVDGLIGNDTLGGSISMKYQKDGADVTPSSATAGEYDIVISGNDIENDNYEVTYSDSKLIISNRSGGGGGGVTTYQVEVEDTANGEVKSSHNRASQGTTVTLTVTPNEGYELASLTITKSSGEEVKFTDKGNGKFSFTMPGSKVTVEAVFKAIVPNYSDCDRGLNCPLWDFTDLNVNAWYHDGVHFCIDEGLMEGYGGGLFAPNKELTRAEAVQILYNLEGQPTVTGDSTFTDLTDDWYVNAITWAEINGVVDGYGDGTFQPSDTVTREEFAQMMYNYTAFKGLDTSATADLVSKFPDGNEVGAWAETAMEWANGNELINGHDDGTLDPQGIAIRAQAASILMRFDLNLVKAD